MLQLLRESCTSITSTSIRIGNTGRRIHSVLETTVNLQGYHSGRVIKQILFQTKKTCICNRNKTSQAKLPWSCPFPHHHSQRKVINFKRVFLEYIFKANIKVHPDGLTQSLTRKCYEAVNNRSRQSFLYHPGRSLLNPIGYIFKKSFRNAVGGKKKKESVE